MFVLVWCSSGRPSVPSRTLGSWGGLTLTFIKSHFLHLSHMRRLKLLALFSLFSCDEFDILLYVLNLNKGVQVIVLRKFPIHITRLFLSYIPRVLRFAYTRFARSLRVLFTFMPCLGLFPLPQFFYVFSFSYVWVTLCTLTSKGLMENKFMSIDLHLFSRQLKMT